MDLKDKELNILKEFSAVSTEQWEEKINKDLKGADYDKKLIWRTVSGCNFKPYYRAENIEGLKYLNSKAGEFPYIRGNKPKGNNWEIRQDISENETVESNKIAVHAIDKGANGIGFKVKNLTESNQMSDLLRYIELEKTSIHFIAAKDYPFIAETFIKEVRTRGADKERVKGSLNFDPFSYYLLYNKFYNSLNENIDEAEYLLRKIKPELPAFNLISINGNFFHNAGASAIQELAFTLSSGNEYLAKLTERELLIDEIAPYMQFNFAIGSAYFLEIAKIRAARLLWSIIVDQYKPASKESASIHIHTETSNWNKSVYDPYVNMLRTTTEAMSGAIAGTDSMTISPFDSTFKSDDEFSRRTARNQQIILQEEAYLNKVADPGAGSYYIESLTDSLAEGAWELFKKIEDIGGFLKAVESGFIRREIEKSATERDANISKRHRIILGANQYPNSGEVMKDKIEPKILKDYPGLKLYRGAEPFEKLRLATEEYTSNGNENPLVYLLTYGNLSMRKARATFATNFFGCTGYNIEESIGFDTIEVATKETLKREPNIVVICSSDEEYLEIVPAVTQRIKQEIPGTLVVVAGYPTSIIEELNKAGVDDYIHVKTDLLQSLVSFQKRLGIIA